MRTLKLDDEHTIARNHSHLFAAVGSALNSTKEPVVPIRELQERLARRIQMEFEVERMEPLFAPRRTTTLSSPPCEAPGSGPGSGLL